MKTNTFVLAAVAALISTGAYAQTTTFANQDRSADAVEDLEEQIVEDAERDVTAFGNEGRQIGSYGSVSLRGTASSSDGDTSTDLGVGLRYGTYDGVNGIDVTASFVYGTDNDVETENQLLLGADYRRDFGPRFFAYGKADAAFDRLSETPGDYSQDIFLGAGVGYRIFNDAQTQWSVQAGPGYRFAKVVGGDDVEEAAASLSSNYYQSLTERSYVTNDTDVIYSDFATTVKNDLALNVAVTDAMTLRTNYTTNYNDQTDNSFSDASNLFGVAVVYNFN
jgi:putative salt-induced outer membrane protein